jgi:hypothetical protein
VSPSMPEHEITDQIDLCLPNGRLNPAAVGWTRRQLHNTGGIARGGFRWGRNKRWEYWGITTPTHIFSLTLSNIDYLALNHVWVLDRATLEEISFNTITPLGRGTTLPDTLGEGSAQARSGKLSLDIDERATSTRLRAKSPRVSFDIIAERPEGSEAMGVVVPWNNTTFQYTVKDVDRPAHGSATIDGTVVDIPAGASFAILDHGRGRWPYSLSWNWGAGTGVVDGRRVGVQLGGRWTVGTGSTENALVVDGRVHKISEELDWMWDTTDYLRPWRITNERVDATFTPFYDRVSVTNVGVIASSTHQCFGHYSGTMIDDTGTAISIDGIVGWAEDVSNRW